jgi:hypothetical protein
MAVRIPTSLIPQHGKCKVATLRSVRVAGRAHSTAVRDGEAVLADSLRDAV